MNWISAGLFAPISLHHIKTHGYNLMHFTLYQIDSLIIKQIKYENTRTSYILLQSYLTIVHFKLKLVLWPKQPSMILYENHSSARTAILTRVDLNASGDVIQNSICSQ